MNPRGLIPFLMIDDVCYDESCSILRYLSQRFPKANKYYPKDPDERYQIEQILDFYTSEFRIKMFAPIAVYVGAFLNGNKPLNRL